MGRRSLHQLERAPPSGPSGKASTGAYWDTDEARAAIANSTTLQVLHPFLPPPPNPPPLLTHSTSPPSPSYGIIQASLLAPHGHAFGAVGHPSKEAVPSPAYPRPSFPSAPSIAPPHESSPQSSPSQSLKSKRPVGHPRSPAPLSPSNHTNLTKVHYPPTATEHRPVKHTCDTGLSNTWVDHEWVALCVCVCVGASVCVGGDGGPGRS